VPEGFKSNRALDAIATRRYLLQMRWPAHAAGWLIHMNMIFVSETASRRTTQALSKLSLDSERKQQARADPTLR